MTRKLFWYRVRTSVFCMLVIPMIFGGVVLFSGFVASVFLWDWRSWFDPDFWDIVLGFWRFGLLFGAVVVGFIWCSDRSPE